MRVVLLAICAPLCLGLQDQAWGVRTVSDSDSMGLLDSSRPRRRQERKAHPETAAVKSDVVQSDDEKKAENEKEESVLTATLEGAEPAAALAESPERRVREIGHMLAKQLRQQAMAVDLKLAQSIAEEQLHVMTETEDELKTSLNRTFSLKNHLLGFKESSLEAKFVNMTELAKLTGEMLHEYYRSMNATQAALNAATGNFLQNLHDGGQTHLALEANSTAAKSVPLAQSFNASMTKAQALVEHITNSTGADGQARLFSQIVPTLQQGTPKSNAAMEHFSQAYADLAAEADKSLNETVLGQLPAKEAKHIQDLFQNISKKVVSLTFYGKRTTEELQSGISQALKELNPIFKKQEYDDRHDAILQAIHPSFG